LGKTAVSANETYDKLVCLFQEISRGKKFLQKKSPNPGTVDSELPCLTVTPKIKGPT